MFPEVKGGEASGGTVGSPERFPGFYMDIILGSRNII
jgi:hypothetical protein